MSATKNNVYSVSQLNSEVKHILEGQVGKIWLNGEISNFSSPSSGHWYLTLKDAHSQIRCAMFKGRNQSVRFKPINGQQILVKGAISVYEPRGDYQLLLESMQPAGDGLLAQEFEALKLKLAAEGLFALETKRPIPDNIQRIGVITSATGAALRDILHVLARRDPSIEVIVYPTQVQGAAAYQLICQAIVTANQRMEVDVLLLARGGGSLEDLWCFNHQDLAHAIYNSALPVISAVGHEIDTTISDYVADVRAPTPSAGAELLSKDKGNKAEKLALLLSRLQQGMKHYQLQQYGRLTQLSHQLQRHEPQRKLQQFEQRFDEMQMRLENALQHKLSRLTLRHQQLHNRLQQRSPINTLKMETNRLSYLNTRLMDAIQHKLTQSEQKLSNTAHQLDTVSPLATLSRGYSITKDNNGKVLFDGASVKSGDEIQTQLARGHIASVVK
ncbi:exodeoxyribonuclease VII large subunit [Shewanella sp. Actino-trap-3]|jgi:exodeoxyribonuclease VII large subunit|uniref:exodeoxyribonuclease VII large subunit n=1 Tax=Shewanella sp. Actino-trap-3 TaxID=2058331 RepID=UPI000C34AC37|nr:exodeoxyribonuclease VII large subunit [Shewanella sp. Actino-trap-3]PKG78265.1 exodeoxyribonuclease VII large subunit [Shewanella sp. Actino-trap-3]|tara:strand:- start:45478 stop:46806 length:1329 start_codon:yes stop_codon:yes gene_type:complete